MPDPVHESLDPAERWLADSLRALRPAVVVYQSTADMTTSLKRLNELRRHGIQATTTHLLILAAARTLSANPALHQVLAGSRRQRPSRVDIGLSITGESFVAPVVILEGADRKTVAEIAEETARRVPEVQRQDREKLKTLRRWGWLLPSGVVRRAIMRRLFASATFRRKTAGTFQVSTVPLDWAATSVFVASGVLVAGPVRSQVVVVDDQPAVRPIMTLTLSGDHTVWDGRAAARFLSAVKQELESGCP